MIQKDLSLLTRRKMYSILTHLQTKTEFPRARQIFTNTLKFFDDKCPGCGAESEKSRLVRIFREDSDFDIATYICPKCGTIYRKYEDKRKPIQGDLLEAVSWIDS
ncbi:hypothetical protein [Biomaibacter acetigenes]|uniref:hypothetical protein n=1 Tax=Biomaibacter acetigenes TaxID=2316383 RepID=UPI0013CEEDE5|nr:hypothetical protein [Biomaibacter acetigenes]